MTKSARDLALLLDVLIPRTSSESFTTSLTGSWSDISVLALDPDQWKASPDKVKPVEGAEEQMVCSYKLKPRVV